MNDGWEGGANRWVTVKNAEKDLKEDVSQDMTQSPTLSENSIYMFCWVTQNWQMKTFVEWERSGEASNPGNKMYINS